MSEHSNDMAAHRATYEGFLRASIVLTIGSIFLLVALCSFAFGSILPMFVGFGGLFMGAIVLLVDIRSGSKFQMSAGLLVLYALFVAISVS